MKNRISKKAFLQDVSKSVSVSEEDVNIVYNAIIDKIFENVIKMNSVSLTGFGNFYLQKHKGHPVQFKNGKSKPVEDYLVLKFSASKTFNKNVRDLAKKRGEK